MAVLLVLGDLLLRFVACFDSLFGVERCLSCRI